MKKLLFFTAILIVKLSIAQIPTNGLVGYWPFNGDANDESGNGNNGTVYGAISVTDRAGMANSAFKFQSSSNQYIEMNVINELEATSEFSISVFFKKNSGEDILVGKLANSNIYTTGVFVQWFSDNMIYISVRNGNTRYLVYDATSLLGTWTHIVLNYNGNATDESDKLKLFVNQVQVGSFGQSGTLPSLSDNNGYNLIVGNYYGNRYCDGEVDDIRIYNRTLSEQEITALYNENEESSSTNSWQLNGNNVYYDGSGNIGIGTNNPAAKLTVNGPILSTEMKIKLDISTYPDFVFKPEYKLKTLPDLEQFIKVNGHLPEIPKAIDVKEGINLGEMNSKLLQKIEELTLYTIEQNKMIEQQNYKITELEKQNESLKVLEEKISKLELIIEQ